MAILEARPTIARGVTAGALVAMTWILASCGSSDTDQADQEAAAQAIETSTTTTTGEAVETTSEAPQEPPSTTEVPPTSTDIDLGEFKDVDGWHYRLELHSVDSGPSTGDECIETAPPGTTNVRGTVRVVNLLDDRDAPWPSIVLGANNTTEGGIFAGVDTLLDLPFDERPLKAFELRGPEEEGADYLITGLSPGSSRDVIPASGAVELHFVLGPVVEPVPTGLMLLGRFFTGGSDTAIDFSGSLDTP